MEATLSNRQVLSLPDSQVAGGRWQEPGRGPEVTPNFNLIPHSVSSHLTFHFQPPSSCCPLDPSSLFHQPQPASQLTNLPESSFSLPLVTNTTTTPSVVLDRSVSLLLRLRSFVCHPQSSPSRCRRPEPPRRRVALIQARQLRVMDAFHDREHVLFSRESVSLVLQAPDHDTAPTLIAAPLTPSYSSREPPIWCCDGVVSSPPFPLPSPACLLLNNQTLTPP